MAVVVQERPYWQISTRLGFGQRPPLSAKNRPLGYRMATEKRGWRPQRFWSGVSSGRGRDLLLCHDELTVQAPLRDMERIIDWLTKAISAPAQSGSTLAGVPAEADVGLSWGTTIAYNKSAREHAANACIPL